MTTKTAKTCPLIEKYVNRYSFLWKLNLPVGYDFVISCATRWEKYLTEAGYGLLVDQANNLLFFHLHHEFDEGIVYVAYEKEIPVFRFSVTEEDIDNGFWD